MNAGMKALLMENLKTLKLSTMTRNLKGNLRQAQQDKLSMISHRPHQLNMIGKKCICASIADIKPFIKITSRIN